MWCPSNSHSWSILGVLIFGTSHTGQSSAISTPNVCKITGKHLEAGHFGFQAGTDPSELFFVKAGVLKVPSTYC